MPNPYVSRRYDPNPELCVRAVALLLRDLSTKKTAGGRLSTPAGPDDARRDHDARTTVTRNCT